ncbi:TPA: DUF3147 family protein [Staphylococcus aureus]|nr:DUF3147 family protein [Staphylococcus aureus]
MKLTLMKFFVGGFAVLLSYIVSVTLPWKEFGGIFATFPAVFLVSMFITGMQYGDKVAVHVSRGAVFGMTGVLVCIFEAVEFIAQKRLEKHSWKAGKTNSK